MKTKLTFFIAMIVAFCISIFVLSLSSAEVSASDCQMCYYEDDGELCSNPGSTCWVVKPDPVVIEAGN